MSKSKSKFILLGWDAADWKTINPLIEQGLMPNLERLMNQGVCGNHATLDPMYSPMLWTSIATGKRPYKHGVHGFHEPWDKGNGVRPVMSTTRTCKAVWNILMQSGYKTHVVGWWPSHPAEPINGTMISDIFPRSTGRLYEPWAVAENSVHPAELENHYAALRVHPEEIGENIIELFVPNWEQINQAKDPRLGAIARETAQAATLHAAFTNIIRTQDWDFAALYQVATDHYAHGFMRYNPPKRPHISQQEYDLYHNVVTAGYRYHDMMLGRIMELVDDDTYIMLVSDHGFQPDHLRPTKIPHEPAGPAYEHSPYGIFVLRGPGIKKDEIVFGASLLDVTPTILTCLGLPVGADMDGKTLTQIFQTLIVPQVIDSWETMEGDCGRHPADAGEDEDTIALALQQLEDLGYIEKQGGDPEENRRKAAEECQFNLARAYVDGGLLAEAIPLLEDLYQKESLTSRYAFQLAVCYQRTGRLKECRQIIGEMRDKEFFNDATLDVMEGSLLLGEGRPIQAIKLFKKAESRVNAYQSRLQRQLAQAYMMLQRWEDAERALLLEIQHDYDHAIAHTLLGEVYARQDLYERAAQSYLTGIGLEYEQVGAHYGLGKALKHLGEYARAAQAFEVVLQMLPTANAAREALMELYQYHLNEPEKVNRLVAQFEDKLQGTIYVVSGLPRSGTSLMMQLLEAGGLPIFSDGKREADDNNTKGYYEHEAVKSLIRQKGWLPEAKDKVVKVVANLLPQLPPRYRYKVIFMERDLHEVLASQRKMLKRLGKKTQEDLYPTRLMQEFDRQIQVAQQWASRSSNVEICYMRYQDILDAPFEQALQINEFLDYQLLPEQMTTVVDKSMHREQSTLKS